MAYGYFVSGIRQNQYHRVAEAAGIGKMGEAYVNAIFADYQQCVKEQVKELTYDALLEELMMYPDTDCINILTGARNATRRNAKFTDVVCLSAETHTVLRMETVTRTDDKCAQRHEMIGTKRLYEYLEPQEAGSVHIRIHCRDKRQRKQMDQGRQAERRQYKRHMERCQKHGQRSAFCLL